MTGDHLDADGIVRESWRGAFALAGRQIAVHAASVLGTAFLARSLTPADFGLFAIVAFSPNLLATIGGSSLGAALVRQPEEPTAEEYDTMFTIQLSATALVAAACWIGAPWITAAYDLPPTDAGIFRIVAVALVLTPLQTLPSTRLERRLAFDRLAVIEGAQVLTFYGLAVALVWSGTGAWSFAAATLGRSAAGALLAARFLPWRPRCRWDGAVAKRQLRFGLLVQGTGLISVVKDSITPIFIGLLLGRAAVGLVDWAQVVAAYPVLVLLILHRLYLPAFSRMQDHPERLGGFVEQVLRATNGFVAPLAVLTLVLIDPVTRVVFGEKWVAAVPLFHLFWAANLFVPTAVPLLALATALGLARAAFGFTLLWAAGTWLLGVPLILRFGLLGYGLANVAVQLTNLMLFRFLQARVSFRILPIAAPYWVAAGAIGGVIFAAERFVPATGVPALAGYFFAGLSAYALALVVVHPGETRRAFAWIQRAGWHFASR